MRAVLVTMTGIGFTLGVVFGLLLQLPVDMLPADSTHGQDHRLFNVSHFRSRSLRQETVQTQKHNQAVHIRHMPFFSHQDPSLHVRQTGTHFESIGNPKLAEAKRSPYSWPEGARMLHQLAENQTSHRTLIRPAATAQTFNNETRLPGSSLLFGHAVRKSDIDISHYNNHELSNKSNTTKIVSLRLTLLKASHPRKDKQEAFNHNNYSREDSSYINSIVNGVIWTPELGESCPKPFLPKDALAWRRHTEGLDVVNIEQGCGRMQNRLVTFRDASKACVRYRLNTDQIQGEIYTYYLSRLFNMSNIPPTMLAEVNSLSSKWRTVHLKMSLAQWADSKLVVLTKYIERLSPSHIPTEFRGEGRRLEPTLNNLGSKSLADLCELVQWSDLIVLDYLTANLDRVANNMFNSQWNDQMMSSPAHNLERQPDGGLVFLDNESGLFHGYRLLDKYSEFHRALLQSLCVFRESTANTVKRLYKSSSIGDELHRLFASNEVLHKRLAAITDKNVKILQKRLNDVYQQISHCERLFDR
ncbi:hypothetical protein BsWGS_27685 [Bradybaena similaris]